jgi:hypothetical protein
MGVARPNVARPASLRAAYEKGYERLYATSEAFVYAAMTLLMVRRLAGA